MGRYKRLGQELKWLPGECAYCNATGKVTSEMLSKISIDNMYLTTNITQDERQKLINNDSDALKRAAYYEMEVNDFIKQVEYLYFTANLNVDAIVEFYLIAKTEPEISPSEKENFIDYIERIIEHKKANYN
ncbi:hypothetical protein [Flavobacterium soli]|uniref:hypothetical protein n=1 Tax=Flavobacterium soli TaxID=344881 RepID=UPI000419159B|nr:hypothetical protein [Flavobacterium soli]